MTVKGAKATAYTVHRLPGRTRFKVVGRRGQGAFFDELAKRLKRLPGVSHVDTNPLTGSVLVHHKGDVDTLLEGALDSDLGEIVDFALTFPPVAKRIRAEMSVIDREIRSFTGGELDLGTVIALGLMVMACVQLMRRQPVVPAVSLAWYGAEILRRWGEPNVAVAPGARGR